MVQRFSPAQARRIALAAQGFGRPLPPTVGTRQLNLEIERIGLLQIDSVNVFERSHYLPLFARLGSYDKSLLDRLTFEAKGRYLEYWAHEAAVIPRDTWPLFRWRMADWVRRDSHADSWATAHTGTLTWLRAELADKGPLAASAIEHDANKRSGPWWGWSEVKSALEILFRWGEVVSAGRSRFERVYGLAEHILPAEILTREVSERDARKQLLEHAARALGIATTSDLADYFRFTRAPVESIVAELAEEGTLNKVEVVGTQQTSWLHRDARVPRSIGATALLSPFDPVVWRRERAERLFNFHYRIEIYTPAHKRVFGYYSLPILVDDSIVGRIDLKNDRHAGVLRVQSAWHEPHVEPATVAERLAPLLTRTQQWQGLNSIEVMDRGTLARAVAAELGVAITRD
ncbi:MAG: crosslink repair DNA glycosylase YcaQ family protein [Terrimesophilobacter sp.]